MFPYHVFLFVTSQTDHSVFVSAVNLLTYAAELLEKLEIVQPLKNFPAFYGTRRYIIVFTRALHWSLS
jgi:hypothetical protein